MFIINKYVHLLGLRINVQSLDIYNYAHDDFLNTIVQTLDFDELSNNLNHQLNILTTPKTLVPPGFVAPFRVFVITEVFLQPRKKPVITGFSCF